MWAVPRPGFDAGETFMVCIGRIRDRALGLRLRAIRNEIEAAASDYVHLGERCELYLVEQRRLVGDVSSEELVRAYDGGLARLGHPARVIYDQIRLLPEGDRCPLCDQRNVATLDHFLPKRSYPIYAVIPVNLVGVCSDCNKKKSNLIPTDATDTLLHPYFDDVNDEQWLFARVVEEVPVALTFHVARVDAWDQIKRSRLSHQFSVLGLAELYASQAARETADIRQNLERHFNVGGSDAVRAELEYQRESRRLNRHNSWQAATYAALAESDWYCDGGFGPV